MTVPATAQLTLGNSGDPENKGIHVTAVDEVSVYGLNRIQYTTDAFLGLPTDVMTTEYVVLSYQYNQASEFAVVATEDGTDVTYTPTAGTTAGVTAGTATTKTLNKGEVLPVSSSAGDLSGSTVTSTKPVAVFGGQQCGNVPQGYAYCDYLVEQLPGTGTWGNTFLTVPLKSRENSGAGLPVRGQGGQHRSVDQRRGGGHLEQGAGAPADHRRAVHGQRGQADPDGPVRQDGGTYNNETRGIRS